MDTRKILGELLEMLGIDITEVISKAASKKMHQLLESAEENQLISRDKVKCVVIFDFGETIAVTSPNLSARDAIDIINKISKANEAMSDGKPLH